jgi:hypothetical protein
MISSVSKKKNPDDWLRDVASRQRNLVFPDTARNEAQFWRNLLEGRGQLTATQRVGVGIMAVVAIVLFLLITFEGNNPFEPNFSWLKISGAGIRWLVAFGILAIILLLFRVSQRLRRK